MLRLTLPEHSVHPNLERAIPRELLINELVTNAYKHPFPGERRGEITIQLVEDVSGRIGLIVVDDGIGLPPDPDLTQSSSLGQQLVPLFDDQVHGRSGSCRWPHYLNKRGSGA